MLFQFPRGLTADKVLKYSGFDSVTFNSLED